MTTILKQRRPHDFYPTQTPLTEKLINALSLPTSASILEPCVGDGAIANLYKNTGHKVYTADIDPQWNADVTADMTRNSNWVGWHQRIDWVITNPPFNQALPIAGHAMAYANVGVALLLRLTWLEPSGNKSTDLGKRRCDFLKAYQDNLQQMIVFGSPRPSFTNNGRSDSATVAWFIFRKDWSWQQHGIPCPFQFAINWKE